MLIFYIRIAGVSSKILRSVFNDIIMCSPGCVPPHPQRRGRHGDPGRAGHAGPGRRLRTRGRQPAPARPRARQEGRHRLPGHQQNCAVITTTLYLFIYCQTYLLLFSFNKLLTRSTVNSLHEQKMHQVVSTNKFLQVIFCRFFHQTLLL